MNAWERVVRAMQLSTPDRVPIYEMHVPPKISSIILSKPVEQVWYSNAVKFYDNLTSKNFIDIGKINQRISEEIADVYKGLGMDWIRVPAAYTELPKEATKVDKDTWRLDGRRYRWSGDTLWTLDEPANYDPDSIVRSCREARIEVESGSFDILRNLARKGKGTMFLSFDADGTWGPIVSNPNLLRHVLVWMYRRPDVVRTLIDHNTDLALEQGKRAIDEGADAIQLCVDYGNKNGPWMPPSLFREFVKPALERHVDAFRRKGAFVVLHSDGYIMPILDDVVGSGISAYQGIDVIAGMDLRAVKTQYGNRICLVGNVDPRAIEFGTTEDVASEVERCIRDGAGGGGYVLSASANVSVNTKVENFLFMVRYARERGTYA